MTARAMNDSRSFSEGQTAVLLCQSDSHGDIQLTWMKDSEQLEQDGDRQIRETGNDLVLTLSDLTAADSGQYVCMARRERESVTSAPITISVTGLVICLVWLWSVQRFPFLIE